MNESMNARWLGWCLTAIVALLAVIAVELGALIGPVESRAVAQSRVGGEVTPPIPDSGLQFKQMIDALDRASLTQDAILQLLRTQTLKVRVIGTDKEARTPAVSPPDSVSTPPAPRVIRAGK